MTDIYYGGVCFYLATLAALVSFYLTPGQPVTRVDNSMLNQSYQQNTHLQLGRAHLEEFIFNNLLP